jgi:trehalose 6-phosphate phosphatase
VTSHPRDALPALQAADKILLALDFDGTLAHLVDNPDDARMTPEARDSLNRLGADPGVVIALVSGRGARNLVDVSEPDSRWWIVGSHGIEVVEPGHSPDSGLTPELLANRGMLWEQFGHIAKNFPGVWVEEKTWGSALHTRGVSADVEASAHQALRPVIDSWGDILTTRTGHGILESSLGTATKGDGITRVAEVIRPDVTVFIGDDVTDEDGFAILSADDVGIKVGLGETRARFRIEGGPGEVAEFLAELASRRGV